MPRVRLKLKITRDDPEFKEFFKRHFSIDRQGLIQANDCYAHIGFNVTWRGKLVSMTYANAVWFLKTGDWPKAGYHIDHIDNNPLNNHPDNLQEITEAENQAKRRGRKVYRSYGKGKYGNGFNLHHDKRDGRFYVSRNVSRGITGGQKMRITYGGYDTREEAEARIQSETAKLLGAR